MATKPTPAADTAAAAEKKNRLQNTAYIAITQPGAKTSQWYKYGGLTDAGEGKKGNPQFFHTNAKGVVDGVAYLKSSLLQVGPVKKDTLVMDNAKAVNMPGFLVKDRAKFSEAGNTKGPVAVLIGNGEKGNKLVEGMVERIKEAKVAAVAAKALAADAEPAATKAKVVAKKSTLPTPKPV